MLKHIIRLAKHSAVYGMGYFLNRSIALILLPLHTNFIDPENFSLYVYGSAFIPFLAIFYPAGINLGQVKFQVLANDTDEKNLIFSTTFLSTLTISTVLTLILVIFSKSMARIIYGNEIHTTLIYISGGILFSDALLIILLNTLRVEEKSKQFIIFNTISILINVALNIIFIVYFKWDVYGIFWANLCASVTTFILLFLFIVNQKPITQFSYAIFKNLFKFGLQIIPSTMGLMILIAIDRFLIREMISDKAATLYGTGYRLGMVMSLIVVAFRYAWQPFYLSTAKEYDADAKEIFSKVLTYFTFVCSIIFLVLSLFIDEIVRLSLFGVTFFGEKYWECTTIVPLILASYFFYGVYLNFQVGVYLKNQTKYLAISTVLSALLNIVANIILIPGYGLMGAAYATLLAYIFMAFSFYFMTHHLYPIQYEWLRLSKIATLVFLIFVVGKYSYPDKTWTFRLIFIAAYFVILYLIGFYEKNEIKKLTDYLKQKLWQHSS